MFLMNMEASVGERALELDPTDLEARTRKGLLLSRLDRDDESREWLKAVLRDHPRDAETWGLLGRVEKEAWMKTWRKSASPEDRRQEAAYHDELLKQSLEAYASGFIQDPGNFYCGINAVTLLSLLAHLTGEDLERERRLHMIGGVRWAAMSSLQQNPKDYWPLVTLADLTVLDGSAKAVTQAYKKAVAVAENDWFQLDSSRQQLVLLDELEYRPTVISVALNVFDRALKSLKAPELPHQQRPGKVILFTGHMIDRPDRKEPRFPASREPVAAEAIEGVLDQLKASTGDLALCSGANGGDLLFAEACLRRGMRLEVRIPFERPVFLRESVTFAGDVWRDRFYAVKANPNTKLFVMPQELGPTPPHISPYSRNNLWQLYSALAWGDENLSLVCLWDGRSGDGPGGTHTLYLNRRHRRSGHFFEQRYEALLVDKDKYLLQVSRYMDRNPVEAKLVERPQDYRWSSYGAYVSGKRMRGVTTGIVLEQLGCKQSEQIRSYREYVESAPEGGIGPTPSPAC